MSEYPERSYATPAFTDDVLTLSKLREDSRGLKELAEHLPEPHRSHQIAVAILIGNLVDYIGKE